MLNFKSTSQLHNNVSKDEKVFGTNVRFYDGVQNTARVDDTTQRFLYNKVVDQVLNSATVASRYIGMGKPFEGKTTDITMDIAQDTQGQWFTGLETLNSSAVNTYVTGSYAQTAFTQPVVSIMLESFANVGSLGIINLDVAKYEKAAQQVLQAIGTGIYSTGAANQMLGFEAIIDDGTNAATIGGLSRSTYPSLDSIVTPAAGNKLTLSQMATLFDAISAAGLSNEEPNAGYSTKAIFSLYESLLQPSVRAQYESVGYDRLSVRGKFQERNRAELRNSAGFNCLTYRGLYLIRDDFATSGVLYFANENYIDWHGRDEVPEEYEDILHHVDFGEMEATEGTGAQTLEMPSRFHGWYFQDWLTIPEQAGRLARFYSIGQMIPKSFRRQGKLTGVTGV